MSNSSEQSAKGPHPVKHLNPPLDKMIAAYATTATAVGVALLAAAPSAEAKIIYTKTNVHITGRDQFYPLDLNHDGIADFEIFFCSCRPFGDASALYLQFESSGEAVRKQSGFPNSAGALLHGDPIGPKQAWISGGHKYFSALMASAGSYYGPYSNGPWLNVTNRYLGLKFLIHGEVHYGWARMSVPVTKQVFGNVVITGYAYETTPNKSLRAGQTTETTANEADGTASLTMPAAHGPSLGMLARGAEAMEVWRRE
jgi:hypothetical protein